MSDEIFNINDRNKVKTDKSLNTAAFKLEKELISIRRMKIKTVSNLHLRYDEIHIPILKASHYILYVIKFNNDDKICYILEINSLNDNGQHNETIQYQEEIKAFIKMSALFDTTSNNAMHTYSFICKKIRNNPHQGGNSNDCGIFCCLFSDLLSLNEIRFDENYEFVDEKGNVDWKNMHIYRKYVGAVVVSLKMPNP
jgi:Ulp1 family protease